jgi:hypothetical protein
MLWAECQDPGCEGTYKKRLHFTEAEDWPAMASARTTQHRALVGIEQGSLGKASWCLDGTGRPKGTRKRLVHMVEAVDGTSRYKRYQIDGKRHRHDTQGRYGGLS